LEIPGSFLLENGFRGVLRGKITSESVKNTQLNILRSARLSIRAKLTLPYILLSVLIAFGGGIIVTRVVIDSLEERFTNQLIETRKLASELVVREEARLLGTLRLLSHIEGVADAIASQDEARILELIYPVTFNAGEDVVLVVDNGGSVLTSIVLSEETGKYEFSTLKPDMDSMPFAGKVLHHMVDAAGDKYAGLSLADWGDFFLVAGPVKNGDGQDVGLILVGRSLDGIVQKIREETLSQATIYDISFNPVSSTLLEAPSPPDVAIETIWQTKDTSSLLRDLEIGGIDYTEILGAMEVRNGDNVGVLGTALPKAFLVRANRITRLNVTAQVVLAILAALFLGIFLADLITQPIVRLKQAAGEVARGNLNVQVNTSGNDEVAVLAQSFNEMLSNLRRSEKNLVSAYDKTIEGWSRALELRDRETAGHTQRVAEMTMELARRMKIREEDMENIRRGALLHDIGKMGIADSILQKPGPLDPTERQIIEEHPIMAREMLRQIEFLYAAMEIPTLHHEKWDGTGYPNGLAGKYIPLSVRVFSVVDVWDALTSDRPYRKAWSRREALDHIIRNSGIAFDPEVVDAFVQFIGKDLDGPNPGIP
jgi:putative nucleotidyltransferase with HDIG domain